ncbi:amidase [Neiella marina]|uniref:Amidase n=1 Tax=Neiella holothuriorum TaxID=2870530 RepID=A0ABS7EBS3_9GAMM|nr:amidase [Neiella holothuriorum]MBW8189777.1 amidase [Neiella holothuriorum]
MGSCSDLAVFSWLNPESVSATSGPLSGLRLGVKDLFDIAGVSTTAGNPDWGLSHPTPDVTSPVVTALMEAGASLKGKTQTDELAYSLNGQNHHFGTPLNPVANDRLPGGSSSGSAVATAAQQVDIGLGTDTGGSIRVPASYNGLFGIRTSHGAISTANMVPLAPRFDTVGWLCRDASTLYQVGQVLLAETPIYQPQSLNITVLEPIMDGQPLWTKAHQSSLDALMPATHQQHVPLEGDWLNGASNCFRVLQGRDIWRTHGDWVSKIKPTFAADIAQRFDWAASLTEQDQQQAEIHLRAYRKVILDWFRHSEVLVLPTTPGPAPLLNASADYLSRYRNQLMGLTAIAGLAGLPQVHLPLLTIDGAPAGISLIGRSGMDLALLALVAKLCEKLPTHNNKGGSHGP